MANLKKTKIDDTGALKSATGNTSERSAVTYTVQSFTSTGPANFTVPSGVSIVDVLVVAGGGGGANSLGGGGGGGGFIEARNFPVVAGATIPVVVGAGGAAGPNNPQYIPGSTGQNSSFGTLIAYGGGAGAGYSNGPAGTGNPAQTGTYVNHGFRGGSGGGGGGTESQWSGKGEGIQGQGKLFPNGGVGWGFPGGSGHGPGPVGHGGGGGGGAGGEGSPATPTTGGQGGSGRASDITGSTVFYAGGGGGGIHSPGTFTTIPGGIGGGGRGGGGATGGLPGTTNTGGGGGCGGYFNNAPGSGGPGIVIVRYAEETATSLPFEGAIRFNSSTNRSEVFSGGVWTALGRKTVQSFTAVGPGTWSVPTGVTEVEVLVVGGGGGAGNIGGGGGGGGVVHHARYPVSPGGSVSYSVGGGGSSGPSYPGNPAGQNGGQSTFGLLTAYGGGGSGTWSNAPPGGTVGSGAGGPGTPGQGQPGGIATQPRAPNGDLGATNYGNPGARGGTNGPAGSDYGMNTGSGQYSGGGGGGAGRSGGYRSYIVNTNTQNIENAGRNFITQIDAGGAGGDGVGFDISGEFTYYGGGGGGGTHTPAYSSPSNTGPGGLGGGGRRASFDYQFAPNGRGEPGQANTGGGGGGGYYTGGSTAQGGDGGPGIIIIRY